MRRELFPPDRGLQARMALALVIAAATAVAAIAVVVWLTVAVAWWFALIFLGFALDGFMAGPGKRKPPEPTPQEPPRKKRGRGRRRRARKRPPAVTREERHARELLGRLAALGELRAPRLAVEAGDAPLTWTTALPWQSPTIHVTTGLLSMGKPAELEAILAHELTHIANRDAWVMTVIAGPPAWIYDGIRVYWAERHEDGGSAFTTLRYAVGMLGYASWAAALALPWALSARAVSRHRELAADRGAAVLTGSPAGVAAALGKLTPSQDLRLELLGPVPRRERRGAWATHPPLERRVAQLERMEAALQNA